MRTTELVVEILVVGVLGVVTLSPPLALLSGDDLGTFTDSLLSMPLLLQLPLAYAAGVVWNRVCNAVFSRPEIWIQNRLGITKDENQESRILLSFEISPLAAYLASTRGVIRVLRAAAILSLSAFVFACSGRQLWTSLNLSFWTAITLSASLSLVTAYSWWRVYRGYLLAIQTGAKLAPTRR